MEMIEVEVMFLLVYSNISFYNSRTTLCIRKEFPPFPNIKLHEKSGMFITIEFKRILMVCTINTVVSIPVYITWKTWQIVIFFMQSLKRDNIFFFTEYNLKLYFKNLEHPTNTKTPLANIYLIKW